MRITTSALLAIPAIALALAAAPSGAAAQQDFRWSGAVPAGQRVEIKGVNGAIRAEPSTGGQVEVTAVIREGDRGRAEDVRIERIAHGRGVTFCAVYPSGRRGRPNRCVAGDEWNTNVQNNDTRVEWVVRVPRGVHFMGATVNGDVSARSLPADATVSTVNGEIMVSAAGIVEASTVNGDIEATTGRADAGRDLEFTTVNGDIVLHVPSNFTADVDAELLNGRIRSDFPIDISRGRYVGASADGRIGRGGHELKMETVNGNLEIRRSR